MTAGRDDRSHQQLARARGAAEPPLRPGSLLGSLGLHVGVLAGLVLALPAVWSRATDRSSRSAELTLAPARPMSRPEPREPDLPIEEEEVPEDPFAEFELVEVREASFDVRELEPEPLERVDFLARDVPSRLRQKKRTEPEPPAVEPEPTPLLVSQLPEPPLPVVTTTRILPSPIPEECTDPAYPRGASRRGLTGTVVCLITVSVEGEVREVEVETTSGHGILDRAARDAVSSWRFRPGTVGGEPREMVVRKRFAFQLPG